MSHPIPFNRPFVTGADAGYAAEAMRSDVLHGDGPFTARATAELLRVSGAPDALLTTSCTHALEMAALLLDLGPGDEVVVPSFTFPSTASAIAVRGAVPVFVDVRPDTLNLDGSLVEAAVTPRTRALFVVHYGGVGADVDVLQRIADRHGLALVEDNAHGLGATWRGRRLGTLGDLATQSFHDTKNVHCGEGGALLLNRPDLVGRAEILREKGTDRSRFLRGQVDKYTWVDLGSSYLPSDVLAAFLLGQLESFGSIQARRSAVWRAYADGLRDWAARYGVTPMNPPPDAGHPAHLFYLLLPTPQDRDDFIAHMRGNGVLTVFHYLPLDSSPAGIRFGRTPSPCTVSEDVSRRLVRLPLYPGLDDGMVARVLEAATSFRPAAGPRVLDLTAPTASAAAGDGRGLG